MFELYSERARRIIFLARLESGARGAEMIDLDDLLAALIVEDQNKIPDVLERLGRTGPFYFGSTTHEPFLPADAAASLLDTIRQSLPRSEPIPTSVDMAISPALGETLSTAIALREKLRSKEVTPLHLLAVLLAGSHKGLQALRDAGITEEKALDVIRSEEQP
jgi:Clp amino terminal domain, pathogenicity island component